MIDIKIYARKITKIIPILLIGILLQNCIPGTRQVKDPSTQTQYFSNLLTMTPAIGVTTMQLPTQTIPLNKNFTPTPSGYPIPTIVDIDLPEQIYFIYETLDGAVYIEEVISGEQNVATDGGYFLDWDDGECGLLYVDYAGNIYSRLLRDESSTLILNNEELKKKTGPIFLLPGGVSSKRDWVWYWQSEGALISGYDMGDQYSRSEKQNLLVVATDLKQGPFPITEHQGGWVAAWSPVEGLIAFSDFDRNHILQIFTSQYDGSKRVQRTNFKEITSLTTGWHGLNIDKLLWSVNGNKLGINYNLSGENFFESHFLVIDLVTNQIQYDKKGVIGLWWVNEDLFVQLNNNQINKRVEIFDLNTSAVTEIFMEKEFGKISNVFQFVRPNWIGFQTSSFDGFYIYDIDKGIFGHAQIRKEMDYARVVSATTFSEILTSDEGDGCVELNPDASP
jgi:hypothetical protein